MNGLIKVLHMNVSLVCGNYIVCMYCHGNHLVHTSGRDFFQNYILFLRNCSFIWVASTMKSTSKYFHFKCFYWNLISPVAAGWCFYFKLDSQLQLRWQLLSINSSSGKQTNKTLSFLTARKKRRARMIYLTGIVQVTEWFYDIIYLAFLVWSVFQITVMGNFY